MFAITGPPEPVGGGPDFSGPASVQYQVLLNFDAIASDQSLTMTLPGFNEEVVAVREMKDLECCFLPGFTVMPDPDAPPEDFIYKWIGKGENSSDVFIAVREGKATGWIFGASGQWRFYYDELLQTQILRYIDPSSFPDVLHSYELPPGAMQKALTNPVSRRKTGVDPLAATDEREINVMVVFTEDARVEAGQIINGQFPPPGDTTAVLNIIEDAMEQLNVAFSNSEIQLGRAKLAHVEQVPYLEVTATGTQAFERYPDHLGWLIGDANVAIDRDNAQADVVVMLIDDDTACGFAVTQRTRNCNQLLGINLPAQGCDGIHPGFDINAFNVVNTQCAAANADFAHEVGHVLGLEHEPPQGVPAADASFPWSYGFQQFNVFKTIMAITCGMNCPRILYFSSADPNVLFNGQMVGNVNQDNARTLQASLPVSGKFRVNPDILYKDSFEL
ncbi:MAG: M12 family metallo-peptidase [Xanthomonadales bacterium]|nr:M12 family metallo-peptidase [Xanthomonadales bacterium]